MYAPRSLPTAISARIGETLTDDQMRRFVPSIFAIEPWQQMSEKYRFVPTIDVLNRMRSEGFEPVRAMQGRSRIEGKREFTRHMIRLQHRNTLARAVGDEIPELVLLNSHDGSSSYQLHAGLLRLVCLNGLVVSAGDIGTIKARHSGSADLPGQVIDASYQIIDTMPQTLDVVREMKALPLRRDHQIAFAAAASELRDSTLEVTPQALLSTRRSQDRTEPTGNRDLWKTMNVVQENVIRGGNSAVNATGQRRHTRAVSSVGDDVRINRGLWRLAEEMRKIAA